MKNQWKITTLVLSLFIFTTFHQSSITVVSLSQEIINSILYQILDSDENYQQIWKQLPLTPSSSSNQSSIGKVCSRIDPINIIDPQRVICCSPLETRILRNVLIENQQFHLPSSESSSSSSTSSSLPVLTTVKFQQNSFFNLEVKYDVESSLNNRSSRCSSFYEGTLHIFPKVTAHNVYHAISDNVMPLVAQILLDSVLDPEYLYLPRKWLHYDSSAPHRLGKNEGEAPHLALIEEIMSDGSITLPQTSGVCYKRVMWGPGPHLFFVDSLQALRRKAAEFIRLVTHHLLKSHRDFSWPTTAQKVKGEGALIHSVTKDPLKIIFYTRGNSGKGRTMKNEESFIHTLQNYGANAFLCCNFKNVDLLQQLYYAYHADIITGLHGAAITHGIFMKPMAITIEMKTLYAYDSILFGVIADSRYGIHAQIDIRKYFKPGGHHPMDQALIQRMLQAISFTRKLQKELFLLPPESKDKPPCFLTPRIESITNESISGDYGFGPHCLPLSINHLLGPTQEIHHQMCKNDSFLNQIYRRVGKAPINPTHCPLCVKFSG